ncbi:hypothetical protein [Tateyamaria sp. SN6-1]|uniref:hypothetical protein n=1 Tax=Tateyamaria sp. SN6-1 TaxID=3092148 RepID=UPI0039F447C0
MQTPQTDNTLIMFVNGAGVAIAYVMLGLSLWLSTDVPLATKGYWGIGILMLTLSLVNFVKYRFDNQLRQDRVNKIEEAKTEKLLSEYVGDVKDAA